MKARLAALLLALPVSAFAVEIGEGPVPPVPALTAPLAAPAASQSPTLDAPQASLLQAPPDLSALALPSPSMPAEALLPPITPAVPGSVARAAQAARPGDRDAARAAALRALQDWADGYHRAADAGLEAQAARNDRLFEGSAEAAEAALPIPSAVVAPRGVKSVSVEPANDPAFGSYLKYVYQTPAGDVVGVDLKSRPELVDRLPDLKPQERVAIKKIQAYTHDLRVLVVEGVGKTPDLEIAGVITELKSWPIDAMDLTHIVNRANSQVGQHAERHGGLGNGAVAVDIIGRERVPAEEVLRELNGWAALPVGAEVRAKIKTSSGYRTSEDAQRKDPIALDRVTVFAGADVQIFARGADGLYSQLPPEARPFEFFPVSGHKPLRRVRPGVRAASTALADAYERARILSDLRGLRERGRRKRALRAWQKFKSTHRPDIVEMVRPEAEAILEKIQRDAEKRKRGGRPSGRRG